MVNNTTNGDIPGNPPVLKVMKPKAKTLLDFVRVLPKPRDGDGGLSSLSTGQSEKSKTVGWTKGVNPNKMDSRNISCPITGCKNFGGRGYRRLGISNHPIG